MPFALGILHALLMFVAFPPVGWWWASAFFTPLPALYLVRRSLRPATTSRTDDPGSPRPVSLLSSLAFGLGTAPFWTYHHWFIGDITAAGVIPLAIYLSLWPAALVWILSRGLHAGWWAPRRRLWTRPFVAAVVWVALDMIRGEIIFGGYGWFFVSQPLIDFQWIQSLGSALGIYGITFLIVATGGNIIPVQRGPKPRSSDFAFFAISFITVILVAFIQHAREEGHTFKAAIVQTNVPQSNKLAWTPERAYADFRTLLDLHADAARSKPDLIVWPETMRPGWVLTDDQIAETRALIAATPELRGLNDQVLLAEMVRGAAKDGARPVIVGQETFEGLRFEAQNDRWRQRYDARFNSAYLVHPDGTVSEQRYDKIEPTPFGETIPYTSGVPWLRDKLLDLAAGGMRVDLSSGARRTIFTVPGGTMQTRLVTPICFESTDTDLVRSMVYGGGVGSSGDDAAGGFWGSRRADVIVLLTNDGWFGDPALRRARIGREVHLQLARWRSLELGTPTIRAANTGMSALIDSRGQVVAGEASPAGQTPPLLSTPEAGREGLVVGTLRTQTSPTLYGRLGNVVGWGCLVWFVAGIVVRAVRTLRRRFRTPDPVIVKSA
jgi:apolipoprotein N-acyltransferase